MEQTVSEEYRDLLDKGYTHTQIAESKTPEQCLKDFVNILQTHYDIDTAKQLLCFICAGSLGNKHFIERLITDKCVDIMAQMEHANAFQMTALGAKLTRLFLSN